jgi:LysM repeat protein
MKVLRIIGIVAAVHAFAFLLIMANPGCSTKPKSRDNAASAETAAPASSPSINVPGANSTESSPVSSAPMSAAEGGAANFDPNAVAVSIPRYSPTRPNTPASTALQAEPVADVTPATTITVGKGDSLWSIAKKYHVPVTDLAAANNLETGTTLRVGKKLVVPSKATGAGSAASYSGEGASAVEPKRTEAAATGASSAPAPKPAADGSFKHVVKPGESLALIAKKYGVKAGVIAEANNISNPAMVKVGRELVIPGWQPAKGAKSSASSSAAKKESAPAEAAPAPAAKAPVMPVIGVPSPEEDLDSRLKPSSNSQVPVIKLDDPSSSDSAPRN